MDGLYLLWWVQEKDLSPALVAAILAAGDFAVMAFELPTGWFADRVGHRRSLIAGSAVQVMGMLWCWLGEGVSGLLAASLIVALGDALRSGADQALLYRSCAALGRVSDFQPLVARAAAEELCALVALTIGGGLVVSAWGFAAGWLAETALCAVGLAIACAMREPPPAGGTPAEDEDEAPTSLRAWRLLFSRSMAVLVVPAAALAGGATVLAFLAQTSAGLGPAAVATLVAVFSLAEAAGSGLAIRWRAPQMALLSVGIGCVIAGIAVASFLPAAAAIVAFLTGVVRPLRAAAIQALAADGMRARAASLASMCDMVVTTVALPLAGALAGSRARR
jgi:hypothetical protein